MRKLILIIIVLNFYSCNAQVSKENKNNLKMEKFNTKRFQENKINGEFEFSLSDGSHVRQMEDDSSGDYTEEISNSKDAFSKIRLYFISNGNIKTVGEKFYNFPIGVWHYYDENGKIINQINWESGYKFTLTDLAKKMKSMEVDILQKHDGVDVTRSTTGSPLYTVFYPVNELYPFNDKYMLTIDGITGETIKKSIIKTGL